MNSTKLLTPPKGILRMFVGIDHSSDSSVGCIGFCTHCIFDKGQTRAIIFPFTRPNGTGP